MPDQSNSLFVYRASDELNERPWLETLASNAASLDLPDETVDMAGELYLQRLPVPERSKPALLAASCYTAALVTGHERSQGAVAEVFDVSRLSVQSRWKDQLEDVGLSPPGW